MSRVKEILEFVRNGKIPARRIVSATFGNDWVEQAFKRPVTSVSNYLEAMRYTEVDNIVCLSTDFGKHNPKLLWKETQRAKHEDGYLTTEEIDTPHGVLIRKRELRNGFDPWTVESAVRTAEDFAKVKCAPMLIDDWKKELETIGEEAVSGVVLLLPVEMCWLVSYSDQCVMYMDYPEQYKKAMDVILESNKAIAKTALKTGVHFIVMGSAGLELFSPEIFRETVIPYAKAMCSFIRENGGLSFYHMCGHSLEIARRGWLNEIHPDIFETFSPPPCGVVKDLAEARAMLAPEICSRGNLPVELLLEGPVEKIIEETQKLAIMTKNWKHIIGVSDTIMGKTTPENIRAFAHAARNNSF